jgi:hypothetical protein
MKNKIIKLVLINICIVWIQQNIFNIELNLIISNIDILISIFILQIYEYINK